MGKGVRVRVRGGIHVAVTKFVFAKAEKQRTFADPCKAKNRSTDKPVSQTDRQTDTPSQDKDETNTIRHKTSQDKLS